MCFLKTLRPLDSISYKESPLSDQTSCENIKQIENKKFLTSNKLSSPKITLNQPSKQDLLLSLLSLVSCNSNRIAALKKRLDESEQNLCQAFDKVETSMSEEIQCGTESLTGQESSNDISHQNGERALSPLVEELFGKKKYNYRLELVQELANPIYKERNINISVKLVNLNGEKILNSNIVHLCLGVCDANGQWITDNRAGQPFMKGKTEIELYHGEGAFMKIYPRDVSRSYADGKLNFVIYSKPSMLKFSSNASSVEKIVESLSIQPFVISDISIKAKKKD